jgi:hypothetical protein
MRKWRDAVSAPLVFLLCAIGGGCDDDATCPLPPAAPMATLENIWPNADSTAWTYEMARSEWYVDMPPLYPTAEQVPPAPSLEEVMRRLAQGIPDSAMSTDAIYRMRFEGMVTTGSGVRAQNLVVYSYGPDAADSSPRSLGQDPLLARLVRVRPDLRDRCRSVGTETPRSDPVGLDSPIFVHGYAWAKSPDWIGGYGDLDTLLAWKYLDRDLVPGASFTHRLLPSLASEVYLQGWVVREYTCHTTVGTFEHCLDVAYMIDYGVSARTDESGVPLGYARSVDIGMVTYAPEVGPVRVRELRAPMTIVPRLESASAASLRLDLIGYGSGVPAGQSLP